MKMIERVSAFFCFIQHIFNRFMEDGCYYRASALTFTSLLALVPLMFVALSVLSGFSIFDNLADSIQEFIFSNFVPSAGAVVKNYMMDFVQQAGKLSLVGSIFLVVTAVLMLFNVEQAFNHIWRANSRRRGIGVFMLYWAILTLSPIVVGISFALSRYVISMPEVIDAAATLGIAEFLVTVAIFFMIWMTFTIIYVAIPNCHVPVRFGLIGGLVSTILYELAHTGFTYYITNFPTYQLIYGALATIPVFLIWIYLLWLIILFCAELTQCLAFRHSITGKNTLEPMVHAMHWIAYLWQAQSEGKSLSLIELVKRDQCQYTVSPDVQMAALEKAKLVVGFKGRYMLAVDLGRLTIADLYRDLPWKLPSVDAYINEQLWTGELKELLNSIEESTQMLLTKHLPVFILDETKD